MVIRSFHFSSIKSYRIALFGIFVQIFLVPLWEFMLEGNSSHGATTIGFVFAELSLFGIIPVLLLYFNRTRKFGALICIIIGILPFTYLLFMFYLYLMRAEDGPKTLYSLLIFSGIILRYTLVFSFIFLAGILHFWKKV